MGDELGPLRLTSSVRRVVESGQTSLASDRWWPPVIEYGDLGRDLFPADGLPLDAVRSLIGARPSVECLVANQLAQCFDSLVDGAFGDRLWVLCGGFGYFSECEPGESGAM